MQAYSLDLRERVVDDRVAGLRTAEVARKYRVSPARLGSPAPAPLPSDRAGGAQAADAVSRTAPPAVSPAPRNGDRGVARRDPRRTPRGPGRAGQSPRCGAPCAA